MTYRTVARDPRYSIDEQDNVIGPQGKVLKWRMCGRYPAVQLGGGNNAYIHHLVAETFIGPRPPGMEILHADDDRFNPAASNLSYGTRQQNEADKVARGRSQRGTRHWNYKHGRYVGQYY